MKNLVDLVTFLYSFNAFFLSLLSSGVSSLGLILKVLKVDFIVSATDCVSVDSVSLFCKLNCANAFEVNFPADLSNTSFGIPVLG